LARWNGVLNKVSHKIALLGAIYDELYFQYCQRWAAPSMGTLDSMRRFPAADVIVNEAANWLAGARQRPFFLWLHLMDPHSPYYPTALGQQLLGTKPVSAHRGRYLNAFWNRSDIGPSRLSRYREEVVSLYDSSVRWVDAQMERLVEVLRRAELWESCIFALTADHGEEFLEHDGRYHPPSSLGEELIHVPLVLHVPDASKKELSKAPFSLLDLAPTLLEAADLDVPAEFRGRGRWAQIREGETWSDPAISECVSDCTNPFLPESRRKPRILSVREERYKLVWNFESVAEELFDLQTDPCERTPLPNKTAKAERQRLLEAAAQHLKKPRQAGLETYLQTRLRDLRLNLATASGVTAVSAGQEK
jgi:arylsulfatase A-like enzyme